MLIFKNKLIPAAILNDKVSKLKKKSDRKSIKNEKKKIIKDIHAAAIWGHFSLYDYTIVWESNKEWLENNGYKVTPIISLPATRYEISWKQEENE